MTDQLNSAATPAAATPAAATAATPVPYTFPDERAESYIVGADLVDPATSAETTAALENAYAEAIAGVPESNILNDWPMDADGNLTVTADLDYYIVPRSSGTYARSSDGSQPAMHVVHLFAAPSVDALRASGDRGMEFIQESVVTALRRKAAAVMGSYRKAGEYTLPATLAEWLHGREAAGSGSGNAANGSLKLYNLERASVAKTIRDGLKGAKITAAELRGVLASRAALMDKFNLHDRPEVEEKLAEKLFGITRSHMLARAERENLAWQSAPATDPETGEAKPETAPWPVNPETGKPDTESLAIYLKPLAIWERDRAETVEEAPELDLADLDNL